MIIALIESVAFTFYWGVSFVSRWQRSESAISSRLGYLSLSSLRSQPLYP